MNLLNHILSKPLLCVVDDEVDTTEMVHRFKDVIHVDGIGGDANGVGFIDIACLVVGQLATLDVVGVIGQINLNAMVDAALQFGGLLLSQYLKQGRNLRLGGTTLGQSGIGRDVPGFPRQEGAFNLSAGTIIASRALRNTIFLCKLND